MNWVKNKDNGILKPGDVFEKYRVEKLLGKGGMGAVYLVRHNVLDSFFALKVLFPSIASKNKQFVDRFIREARLACKIKHPNLIAVHDAGKNSENGMYYIIMDYVSGGSVRDLLKKEGRISPVQSLSIIRQIASALETAQKHNMVHRDIKPDNIMFASDGTAKLADLGIAKSTNEQDTMLTMEASVFGTPAYMSPEQAMDSRKVDCRADIYSLGIVFYEMLSGQRPYRGDNTIEILSQVVRDENISDIRTIMPSVPDDLAELLNQMCAKNIQQRIQSPSELLKRLGKIVIQTDEEAKPDKTLLLMEPEVTMPTMVHAKKTNHGNHTDSPDVTMPTIEKHPLDVDVQPAKPSKEIFPALSNSDATMLTLIRRDSMGEAEQNLNTQLSEKSKTEAAPIISGCANTLEVTMSTMEGGLPHPDVLSNATESSGVTSSASIQTFPNVIKTNDGREASAPTKYSSSLARLDKKKILIITCACFFTTGVLIIGIFFTRLGEKPSNAPLPEQSATPPSTKTVFPPSVSKKSSGQGEPPGKRISDTSKIMSTPEESPFDPLTKDTFVLLGGATEQLKSFKKDYITKNGSGSIAFLEAENFSQYRKQLSNIIGHMPRFVLLAPAGRYAELGISRSNFDMLILNEANMLRDKGIPFAFVMENPENSTKIQELNNSIRELCNLRSFTLIDATEDGVQSLYAKISQTFKD